MQPQVNEYLIHELTKAINGEYYAIGFYEHLANIAPDEATRKRILEIREDEIQHYQHFSYVYMSLTGKQLYPQVTEPFPQHFKSGVNAAFIDEQETVSFYYKVARHTDDPYIMTLFERAAMDEQKHAVWFLYFMIHK